MSHYGLVPPTLLTMGLALQPALALSAVAPQQSLFDSPAMQLLFTGLITAGVLYLTNWFHQRNLKMSIENITLQAQKTSAELRAQAVKVDKIAENTATTQVAQTTIAARVDGQMTALNSVIEGLRSDLVAAQLAIVTEEEKARQLAIQAIKDAAASEAKLLAVTITATTVPVHDSTPPAEASRIVLP